MNHSRAKSGPVVLLSGGTGGAKLARGLLDIVGGNLIVIANTGDDIEIHGAYVSPDPDLICFWLADRIDQRGWGLAGDSSDFMASIKGSADDWFTLGDEDRAIGIRRGYVLKRGGTLTQAIGELTAKLEIAATVLPASDNPIRTEILTGGRWIGFQEFMIREQAKAPIEDVRFTGAELAAATPQVLHAIMSARAIIIGPSNPVASIGPILEVCADALRASNSPVVAISPVVDGKILKGPTREFMTWAGHETSTEGVASYYGDIIDLMLDGETLMDTAEARRSVAQRALTAAEQL